MQRSRLEEFVELGRMTKKHEEGIVAISEPQGVKNSLMEAINGNVPDSELRKPSPFCRFRRPQKWVQYKPMDVLTKPSQRLFFARIECAGVAAPRHLRQSVAA